MIPKLGCDLYHSCHFLGMKVALKIAVTFAGHQRTSMDNVIELKRPRTRSRSIDKRVRPRLDSDDRLFAQVVLSAEDPSMVGLTLACKAVNFSLGGLQFTCSESLPPGTLLDLWIDASSRPGKFFLSGEVRWARFHGGNSGGDSGWSIGVQLRASAATDYQLWRDYLSRVVRG